MEAPGSCSLILVTDTNTHQVSWGKYRLLTGDREDCGEGERGPQVGDAGETSGCGG